ncbi:hypothetical protein WNY37_04375 [Henriciella sp. AS95]|uniref:hypothetical protein n=1 Tax=Henriciella sp. AS95 TaxID=3135782 RepID=UPI00317D5307
MSSALKFGLGVIAAIVAYALVRMLASAFGLGALPASICAGIGAAMTFFLVGLPLGYVRFKTPGDPD